MKHRPKQVKLDGQVYNVQSYKAPCAVVLSTDDDYPMFGRVDNVNLDVLADVNILETLKFRPHYYCYIVERTVRQKIKSLSCFYNPFPLHVRVHVVPSSEMSIVVKHDIHV